MTTLMSLFANYIIWAITVSIDCFFFFMRVEKSLGHIFLIVCTTSDFLIIIIHYGLQIIETLASIIFLC